MDSGRGTRAWEWVILGIVWLFLAWGMHQSYLWALLEVDASAWDIFRWLGSAPVGSTTGAVISAFAFSGIPLYPRLVAMTGSVVATFLVAFACVPLGWVLLSLPLDWVAGPVSIAGAVWGIWRVRGSGG